MIEQNALTAEQHALRDEIFEFLLDYRAEVDREFMFIEHEYLFKLNDGNHIFANSMLKNGSIMFSIGFNYNLFLITNKEYCVFLFECKSFINDNFKKWLENNNFKNEKGQYYKNFKYSNENVKSIIFDFLNSYWKKSEELLEKNFEIAFKNAILKNKNADKEVLRDSLKIQEIKKLGIGFQLSEFIRNFYPSLLLRQKVAFLQNKKTKPNATKPTFAVTDIIVNRLFGIKKMRVYGLPQAQWLFLVGNNGYGKTCVLRSIFLALNGVQDGQTEYVADETVNHSFVFCTENNIENVVYNSLTDDKKSDKKLNIMAYGTSRLLTSGGDTSEKIERNNAAGYSLFEADGVLLNIETQLMKWFYREKNKYETVCTTLAELMPNIAKVYYDEAADKVFYIEKNADENGEMQELPPVRFRELATGYRSIVAMIGDLLIRLWRWQPAVLLPQDFIGIVLIDELEVHLHPIWQKKLPMLLSSVFPKIQFIASTHSPIPLLGAPKGSAVIRIDRDVENGITAQQVDIDIATLTPNTILSSPIFGFNEIISSVFDATTQTVRTEDKYEDIVRHDKIAEDLLQYAGSAREQQLLDIFKPKTQNRS